MLLRTDFLEFDADHGYDRSLTYIFRICVFGNSGADRQAIKRTGGRAGGRAGRQVGPAAFYVSVCVCKNEQMLVVFESIPSRLIIHRTTD